MRPRGRVVCWFVCLCVHLFSACSVFSSPPKLPFSSGKVALGINQHFFALCIEASTQKLKKVSLLTFRFCLNRAFFFDDRVNSTSLFIFLYDNYYHTHTQHSTASCQHSCCLLYSTVVRISIIYYSDLQRLTWLVSVAVVHLSSYNRCFVKNNVLCLSG